MTNTTTATAFPFFLTDLEQQCVESFLDAHVERGCPVVVCGRTWRALDLDAAFWNSRLTDLEQEELYALSCSPY